MTLIERIQNDIKGALKAGDRTRLETLRTLKAALKEKEIERRISGGMSEEDEIAALRGAEKKRKESIEQFRLGNRPDLVAQEEKELTILQEYLPPLLSAEEIQSVVKRVVSDTGAATPADFGRVMPLVMKQVRGRADGKTVQEIVRKTLGAA
jgi:uncharacterized protein YqeY